MTMVQMVGVLILALGIPPFFASIEHGEHVDNAILVAGYVVMRIALVGQWLRAAKQDPAHRVGVPDLRRGRHGRSDRLDRHDLPAHLGTGDVRGLASLLLGVELLGPVARGEPARAARRGTRTTSPSATACWRSSRSARVWSARSPRCRRWSGARLDHAMPSSWSWPVPG